MDDSAKAEFERLSKALRAELKEWENEWASSHNGSKPSRSAIKQNPEIARKYKEYQQVRDILTGKVQPPTHSSPKKRKSTQSIATPSKRTRHSATPSKPQQRPDDDEVDVFTPAISRTLWSPAPPSSLGPTPQRDGRVLGLFDLLSSGVSPSTASLETPSRRGRKSVSATLAAAQATPSRGAGEDDEDEDGAALRRLWRTPMSTSKRQLLDTFLTPLKKGEENALAGTRTPSSSTGVSKLQFDTPAFLRRAPLPMIDENGDDFKDPAPLKLPRKPLGRGLSSIVASLRKVEEEALDDDLDALREMEAEGTGAPKPQPKPKPAAGEENHGKDGEEAKEGGDAEAPADKSQPPALLGGFDDEGLYDSPTEDQLDRNGQPLRVYKKKGQKRTTRLHKMKPVRAKRPAANADQDADEPTDDSEDELAQEPRTTTRAAARDNGNEDDEVSDLGSDFEVSEDEDDKLKTKKTKAKKAKKESKTGKPAGKPAAKNGDGAAEKGGTVKKTARKVNAMAHANFKRLKLRNSGSKGGPGFNSRFRRRK